MDNSFFTKLFEYYQIPKVRFSLFLLLAFLLLWGVVRSCSGNSEEEIPTYKIARDPSWYPFELQEKEHNMIGFTNDLFEAISKVENVRFEVFDVSSKSLFFGLDRGNWDGVLSSLTPDVFNQQRYLFSDPFYSNGWALVVPIKSNIKSFEDLNDKIVAVPSTNLIGTIANQAAIFVPYANMGRALEDLDSNKLNAVLMNYVKAEVMAQGLLAGKIRVIAAPVLENSLRLVTKKTTVGTKLVTFYNNGIDKLLKDGTFAKLLQKWSLVHQ